MVKWSKLFSGDEQERRRATSEFTSFLPRDENEIPSAIAPEEVTKIALRLKYQIEAVIPCELEEGRITTAHSSIITPAVIKTAKEAGGKEYRGCVVYCLLVCQRWFKRQANLELWDAELHYGRATACEVIAKLIIEGEEDVPYLHEHVLLKRYSTLINGEPSPSANAIERAVDHHALRVIGSSGYQKAISWIWQGWLIPDDVDSTRFVEYKHRANPDYMLHFHPDRIRVPKYQNAMQITFTLVFLGLFTGAINTINPTGDVDVVEGLLYLFTLGFICDELSKLYKVGRNYLGFWNLFNLTLYGLTTVSFVTRMIALGHRVDDPRREDFNVLSYNFLAFSAPMFWLRLLLYLDSYRFFGAMLVVLKVMMKESLIFFALLFVVLIGFLQAFIGLDQVDANADSAKFILTAMTNAIMGSPEFDGFDNFAPPFGITLYYIYNFITVVILLNILVALYNSAYSDITEDATDEYMALLSLKTLQFVRAPDENVFIPPLNLIELFFLVLPFEWWMSKEGYRQLNDYVMGVLYAPLLVVTAFLERRSAERVRRNRKRGEEDDGSVEEWEQLGWQVDDDWQGKVEKTTPDVEVDRTGEQVRKLQGQVQELRDMMARILEMKDESEARTAR